VKKDWVTHELKINPQEIDDFYAVIFPSPKSGRNQSKETKTQESKPKNKPENSSAPGPITPVSSIASTIPETPKVSSNTVEAAPSVTPPPVTPSIPTNTIEAERVVGTNEKEATLDTPEDIENAKNLVSLLGRLLNLLMNSRDRSLNGAQDRIDSQIIPALKPILDKLGINIEIDTLKEFFDNVTMDSEFTKALRKIFIQIYSPEGNKLKSDQKNALFTELFKKYVIKP
jgi:hypothetical protein